MDIARVGMGCIVFGGLEGWDGGGLRLVLLVLLVAFEALVPPHGGTFWCKVFGRKGLSLDFC
jgi:hypothetical protein